MLTERKGGKLSVGDLQAILAKFPPGYLVAMTVHRGEGLSLTADLEQANRVEAYALKEPGESLVLGDVSASGGFVELVGWNLRAGAV